MKTFAELGFPGRLIAVEGLDGSGKSTQIYLLKRWLELQGLKVYFSEWNSSDIVKAATSKGKKRELLTPTTFSLIHATDFADRYERHLAPLMRAGYLVCRQARCQPQRAECGIMSEHRCRAGRGLEAAGRAPVMRRQL